jgi:hypothetical protein
MQNIDIVILETSLGIDSTRRSQAISKESRKLISSCSASFIVIRAASPLAGDSSVPRNSAC